MTVAEAIEEFLTFLVGEKGDSKKTLECYTQDLREFQEHVGGKPAEELDVDDFQSFLLVLNEKGLSKATLARKGMAVRGLYKYLKGEGKIDILLSGLKIPGRAKRLPETLQDSEIRQLFSAIGTEDYKGSLDMAMMELCYCCGLRVSELVDMRLDQVNLKGGYLKIFGKGGKERVLPIAREAALYLGLYLERRKKITRPKPFLFLHENGLKTSRQYFFLMLRKRAREAGIEKNVHPHMLRHTFATTLLENGAPIRQVQELLGHSQVETTMIYTHVSGRLKKESYDRAMKREETEKEEEAISPKSDGKAL